MLTSGTFYFRAVCVIYLLAHEKLLRLEQSWRPSSTGCSPWAGCCYFVGWVTPLTPLSLAYWISGFISGTTIVFLIHFRQVTQNLMHTASASCKTEVNSVYLQPFTVRVVSVGLNVIGNQNQKLSVPQSHIYSSGILFPFSHSLSCLCRLQTLGQGMSLAACLANEPRWQLLATELL